MTRPLVPARPVTSARGMVCSPDAASSAAGVAVLRAGGNAVDAAIATSAALGVTTPNNCGIGGDVVALVGLAGQAEPEALLGIGRAGSGADAATMRAEGLTAMPLHDDMRSATVPGCVDGWLALHERHGRLGWTEVLAPAVELARGGFACSPLLSLMAGFVADRPGTDWLTPDGGVPVTGQRLVRPGLADVLDDIANSGRDGFYAGAVADELVTLGDGVFAASDLAVSCAEWVAPLSITDGEHHIWTLPAPSQGYLTLLTRAVAAAVASDHGLDLTDPVAGLWVHVLVESALAAGVDRLAVLHDGADLQALLDPSEVARRAATVDPADHVARPAPVSDGDTIHLCTADDDGMMVSLTQSNAAGFGTHLFLPTSGIGIHDRGLGFSLTPGHPAELAPGRRPPHTLSPAMVTHDAPVVALGTMGGDSQPQILAQVLSRLLDAGADPAMAVAAPRAVLRGHGGRGGFDTWAAPDDVEVAVEGHAPATWVKGLISRGHAISTSAPFDHLAGHCHVLARTVAGTWAGASDPRAETSATAVW